MRKPWIAVQLPMPGVGSPTLEPGAIERVLSRARELARADAVILRPGSGRRPAGGAPALTGAAGAARRLGMEVLLWFPVLADTPGAPPGERSLTRNADRSSGHGRAGTWEGLAGSGEESFLFHCPNDHRVMTAARSALLGCLDSLEVDGVMLDKIRFPSPSNGFEALLCCFCESCAASFEKATGLSMEETRRKSAQLLELLRSRGPSVLDSRWTDPGSFWNAAGLSELAGFRARSVTAVVEELAGLARQRSLRVGLDLFSTSLAPLVGQDYEALSGLCDWLKPMTYRAVAGPAGLPLEIASLWKGLQVLHPAASGGTVRALLERVYQWELPGSETELLRRGLPPAVIASELAALRRMPLAATTKVFAGIEAVQFPELGIHVDPHDLEASVEAAGGLADGLIASWDLLHIPEENLRVIGSVAR